MKTSFGSMLDRYRETHRHPVNKAIHSVGIPAIIVSLPLFFVDWRWGAGLFFGGWILQFVGHLFERKPPAFLSNPLFLVVGPWWLLSRTFRAVFSRTKSSGVRTP